MPEGKFIEREKIPKAARLFSGQSILVCLNDDQRIFQCLEWGTETPPSICGLSSLFQDTDIARLNIVSQLVR